MVFARDRTSAANSLGKTRPGPCFGDALKNTPGDSPTFSPERQETFNAAPGPVRGGGRSCRADLPFTTNRATGFAPGRPDADRVGPRRPKPNPAEFVVGPVRGFGGALRYGMMAQHSVGGAYATNIGAPYSWGAEVRTRRSVMPVPRNSSSNPAPDDGGWSRDSAKETTPRTESMETARVFAAVRDVC